LSLRHPVWCLVLLCFVLFVPGLFSRDLWAPDEPRYAEVAREMYVTGQYVVPHLNGQLYKEKPPLFFALTGVLYHVFGGPSVFAGRLVSALAGLGVALLTYELGRRWSNRAVGLAGGAMVATAGHFAALAQAGVLDVPLSFFVLLAVYAFYRGTVGESAGGRAGWRALACLAMVLGVMVKGPVGAAVLLRRWSPVAYGLIGFAIAVAVAAGWVYAVSLQGEGGGTYLHATLVDQSIDRITGTGQHGAHEQPWHYYFKAFPPDFMPWTMVLPVALGLAIRHWRDRELRAVRFYVLWFALVFIFFSCIGGKRERYLMPVFPGVALLCGELFFGELRSRALNWRWIGVPAIVWSVVIGALALVGIAFPFLASHVVGLVNERQRLGAADFIDAMTPGRQAGVVLFAVGIVAIQVWGVWRLRAQSRRFLLTAILSMVMGLVAVNAFIYPAFNMTKSARPLSEAYLAAERPGDRLMLFDEDFNGAYNFYLGRNHIPIVKLGEPLPYPTGQGDRLVLIANIDEFAELSDAERGLFTTLYESQVGHKHTLLVAASQAPSAPRLTPSVPTPPQQ